MTWRTPFVAAAFVSAVTAVTAHHSLSEYDSRKQITLNVTVREFHFVNPHPYLLVDVRVGPFANSWRLELDNRFELVDIGMSASTFRRGDELVVSGSAGRDRKTILYVRELDRASDGFHYEQVGSSPRITRSLSPPTR